MAGMTIHSMLMPQSPSKRYHDLVAAKQLTLDPKQLIWLPYLDELFERLTRRHRFWSVLWTRLCFQRSQPVKGLYLWGGVGIGKTQLMDVFFETLPIVKKKRIHFHQFMKTIHVMLTHYQGRTDPLKLVAKSIADEAQVLCFDEFVVDDITDAMLLGGLLKALFAEGVCFVATSNVAPDKLYQNGLQRELFLPAIALIQSHMQVVHCESDTDHRLLHSRQAGVFYTPLDEHANHLMQQAYRHYSQQPHATPGFLTICQRRIATRGSGAGVAWFDFYALCDVPRSQQDYLEIAEQFQTVLVSDVPQISARQSDLICNFIHLIDVLYDQKIRLVMSAETNLNKIYPEGRFAFQFMRTQSRLLEMQSPDYYGDDK